MFHYIILNSFLCCNSVFFTFRIILFFLLYCFFALMQAGIQKKKSLPKTASIIAVKSGPAISIVFTCWARTTGTIEKRVTTEWQNQICYFQTCNCVTLFVTDAPSRLSRILFNCDQFRQMLTFKKWIIKICPQQGGEIKPISKPLLNNDSQKSV